MLWELIHAISKDWEPFCLGYHHSLHKFPSSNVEFMHNRKFQEFELFSDKYTTFFLVVEPVLP